AAVPDVADEVLAPAAAPAALGALLAGVGRLRRPAAHLEDQLAVAVVEDADLRVGRLPVVDVAEAPADAAHTLGQLVLVQAPAGLVHLVDALVAQVSVAGVPHQVPVVRQPLAHQRLLRGGPAPEVVVDRLGDRRLLLHLADAGAELVAQAARQLDLAELARVQEGDGLAHPLVAAALGAGLADLLFLAG